MVYCGKPSKGCANCRKRRIRCDQARPSCGQCAKVEKECPGYRNLLDLSFRNESSSIIEKVKARYRRTSTKPEEAQSVGLKESNSPRPRPLTYSWDVTTSPSSSLGLAGFSFPDYLQLRKDGHSSTAETLSTFSMYPTIEDRGMSYFASNFITALGGPSHGSFSTLYEIKQLSGGLDDTLVAGIRATGLAGLANKTKTPEIMRHARQQYALALRAINRALGSPIEALKDSTLLGVLILAIFETTAGSKQLTLKEWRHHMNGAAALLKLRGRAQLFTPIGFKIFMHASTHVMVGCLHREVPMPPQLLELRKEAFLIVGDETVWRYLRAADEFTIFRGAVRARTLTDPEGIIAGALSIDRKLAEIFLDVPHGWIFETVYTEIDQYIVFGRSYDIYYDHCIAQTWNGMRTSRIMLNETIQFQLTRLDKSWPGYKTQLQDSTNICNEMRDAILRSVPQHLGYVSRMPFQGSPPSSSTPSASSGPLMMSASHPSLGGWFLLWPLYIAGTTRVASLEMRTYAASILEYVGETIGIKQGTDLATFVREHSVGNDEASAGLGMATDSNGKILGALRIMMAREDQEVKDKRETRMSVKIEEDDERGEHVECIDGRLPLTDTYIRLYDNSYGYVKPAGLEARVQAAAAGELERMPDVGEDPFIS